MRPLLVFDKEGHFVKELIGFAENDVPDSVVLERPLEWDQVDNSLFEMVDSQVVIRERTPAELEASRESMFHAALIRRLFGVLFRMENRIQGLEGRAQLTREEYRENLKEILGFGTETLQERET